MTLPETYRAQLQHIQESPKFQRRESDGTRSPVPFPGYTVITPTWEDDRENTTFYESIKFYQQTLLERLEPGFLIPVPSTSFHLTLADLIWDSAYRHAIESNPAFEKQLRDQFGEIFQQFAAVEGRSTPLRWQLLGIVVRTRALGVCLAPRDESSYDRLVRFRRATYQNPGLMALGIEQQYHLTAHITLGYFGDIPDKLDQDAAVAETFAERLSGLFTDLNHEWLLGEVQELRIHQAELRKFDDMTHYYRQPEWPILKF